MKKLRLPLTLSIVLVFGILAPLTRASFPDVPKIYSSYDAINWGQSEGIIQGNPDGTFRPFENITRAAFLKIVLGALDEGYNQDAKDCFPDAEDWFEVYVCAAFEMGIVSGYPDGTFKPANYINMAEAAKILTHSVLGVEQVEQEDPWFRAYIFELWHHQAIPVGITSATQLVKRGEMMEMIYRIKNNITDLPTSDPWEIVDQAVLEYSSLFKSVEHGFSFIYPKSWPVPAYTPGESDRGSAFKLGAQMLGRYSIEPDYLNGCKEGPCYFYRIDIYSGISDGAMIEEQLASDPNVKITQGFRAYGDITTYKYIEEIGCWRSNAIISSPRKSLHISWGCGGDGGSFEDIANSVIFE